MLTPFGTALRKLRLDKGLRLLDLARALGQSSAYISAVETGRKQIPSGYIENIGRALSLTEAEIKTLAAAADQTRTELKVEQLSTAHRELVAQFARKIDELPTELLDTLRKQIFKSAGGERPFHRHRRGLLVSPRSKQDIRTFAEYIRSIFIPSDVVKFPIMDVLEFRLGQLLPQYNLIIGDKSSMDNDEGRVQAGKDWIMLRQDVYEGAWEDQGRDRFTAAHELGHYLLHRNVVMARVRDDSFPIYRDAEWQADEFAGNLLISSRHMNSFAGAEDAARQCVVSSEAARVMWNKSLGRR